MCDLIVDLKRVDKKKVIRNLILSMDSPFNMEEVVSVTKKYKVFDSEAITSIISDLCETGLIIHIGDLFYLPKQSLLYA